MMSKHSRSKRFIKHSSDVIHAKEGRQRNVRTMAEAENEQLKGERS